MKSRAFRSESWIPQPLEKVFEFFSNAEKLNEITPSWLHFSIVTPTPVDMRKSTILEYRLKLRGIPVRWLTEITVWEPPHRFVDQQRKGPYQKWIHTHTFESKNGGTLVKDLVEYEIGGWILEPLLYRLFVGPDLRKIFDFRSKEMERRLKG